MPRTKAYEPELFEHPDGRVWYLSDDGSGAKIGWDRCHSQSGGCGKSIMECNCKGGPVEPYYITRWRAEAQGLTFEKVKSAVSSVGTSVRAALAKAREPEPPPTLSMSSFVDAEVIAKVKAAKEERDGKDQ